MDVKPEKVPESAEGDTELADFKERQAEHWQASAPSDDKWSDVGYPIQRLELEKEFF